MPTAGGIAGGGGGGGNPSGFNAQQIAPIMGTQSGSPGVPGVAEPWPGGTTMPLSGQSFSGTSQSLLPVGGSPQQILEGFKQAGYPSQMAAMLANFISQGAGFSPQVMQWLFQSMQPQIQQGEANIMEQFGGAGLGNSSSAQYGMSNYLSNVNLNQEQIASQMYEQSVQNYLSILTGSNQKAIAEAGVPKQGLGSLLGGAGQLAGGLGSLGQAVSDAGGWGALIGL